MAEAVDITTLPASDLNKLRQSLSEDVQLITNNFGNLKVAQSRYAQALEALASLTPEAKDKRIMVPLTGSMYVPGTLSSVDSVLVDIGTGYFVEKPIDQSRSFIVEKLKMLAENLEKVGLALSTKRRDLDMVTQVLQAKMAAIKTAQDKAQLQVDKLITA